MSRYGIAEWYGRLLMSLTPAERCAYAAIAMGEAAPPACPFRPMVCNKRGGVCSIQPYREADQRINGVAGEPVIVCPTRFEQDMIPRSYFQQNSWPFVRTSMTSHLIHSTTVGLIGGHPAPSD